MTIKITSRLKAISVSVLALALAACSGGGDKGSKASETPAVEAPSSTPIVEILPELQSREYAVYGGVARIGFMNVEADGNALDIKFEFKNNGRGPTVNETLVLADDGTPLSWDITGNTTFGSAISESLSIKDGVANWQSAAGPGEADYAPGTIYVDQNGGPFGAYIYARALLADADQTIPALPGGQINLKRVEDFTFPKTGDKGTIYALNGISLNPTYLMMTEDYQPLSFFSPRFAVLPEKYEADQEALRDRAAELNAQRFETIAETYTHNYDRPVRIKNVRVFDAETMTLGEPASVLLNGQHIKSIDELNASGDNEVLIDGAGGTLIPGLYDMHGHMSDNAAIMNVLAGVTSVRDMGNENAVLGSLIEKINSGRLIGPRITRSGFIEGKSATNNTTSGIIAATQEEALEHVRMYGETGDFHQIKIYSSVKGEWVPAMAAEAEKYGMRVAGHVPAFSKPDEMIEAGYDEITHINQLMLGWVLDRDEDTRTLFRITGMKRFADLDLNSDKVRATMDLMVEKGIAVDPTTVIHETAMTGRNGIVRAGTVDYIDNMPVSVQRGSRQAMLNVADETEDKAYRAAFEVIIDTLSMLHDRGVLIVPGTDMGGAFELHRELELFQRFGMTNPEILRRGSYDMASYLGVDAELGTIEAGKLADFFLVPGNPTEDIRAIKTISMVVADGRIYFPSEIYPEFGIKPFTDIPEVKE